MQPVKRFPIDYDALQKGSIIPVERLEQITGKTNGTDAYSLAVLNVKGDVERELYNRGNLWAVRIEKGTLKILTDAEAVTYTHAEQVRARSLQMRRFAVESAIDVSNLDDDQKRQHDRNIEINGKHIQAMTGVREQLKLMANKRTVPGLPAE